MKLISILSLLFLLSCSTSSTFSSIDPKVVYRHDMEMNFNGHLGQGVLVVPEADVYKVHITAPGELDLFTFTNCHREEVAENAGNVTTTTGKIFKRKIENKNQLKMEFSPSPLEKRDSCLVQITGLEESKGRHSWGIVDFESSTNTLPALLSCNGSQINAKGVSICQARAGLIQAIKFPKEVYASPDASCPLPKNKGDYFEFPIQKGKCVYAFMTKEKEIHRLTTLGYEQILIRKE